MFRELRRGGELLLRRRELDERGPVLPEERHFQGAGPGQADGILERGRELEHYPHRGARAGASYSLR